MKIHFINCCWFLVSKTSEGPCQWTESWILYRGWCWCWERKTSEYISFLYNFTLLSRWAVTLFHAHKSTCLVFILKPCDITCVFHCLQTMWNHSRIGIIIILLWHFINLWSVGTGVQKNIHGWSYNLEKVLILLVILKSPWIRFKFLKSTWFLY